MFVHKPHITKVRQKLEPHPPTKNTLWRISNLALRCSAITMVTGRQVTTVVRPAVQIIGF